MSKIFHVLTIFIFLAMVSSGLGLFFTTGGKSIDFINQYGDNIILHGDGMYKNDSLNITYVLDMGIISPLVFICMYNLLKKNDIGYILLGLCLTLLIIIGIILPFQTIFQVNAGIELPLEAIITKVGIFIVLAVFAVFYNIKLLKSLNE